MSIPPLHFDYHVHEGDHRPITLVFAADRTKAALKQALFARQTVVYSGNRLIGDEKFLRPIFDGSLEIHKAALKLKKGQQVQVQIHNRSDLDYALERTGGLAELSFPKKITLPAQKTVLLAVTAKEDQEGLRKGTPAIPRHESPRRPGSTSDCNHRPGCELHREVRGCLYGAE